MKHIAAVLGVLLPMWLLSFNAIASVQSPPEKFVEKSGRVGNEPRRLYGVEMEGMVATSDVIKPGDTLSAILKRNGVSSEIVTGVSARLQLFLDVRRIEAGRPYCIIRDPATGSQARYFVYEQTPTDYIVFDLNKPVMVYRGRKVVRSVTRRVSGNIAHSLDEAIQRLKLDPELGATLEDIYGKIIDLKRLQKGDTFKVIFEENYADDELIGLGDVVAAVFTNSSRNHYAFRFSHHGTSGYYDENGNSLEKAFLRSPLRYRAVSSRFSKKRLHPIRKTVNKHPAIDYSAPFGTQVLSVADGIIIEAGNNTSAGKFISIEHPGSYSSQYLHLSAFAEHSRQGSIVRKGDVIGYVGSTGLATGPHLDFRFKVNGRYVDYTRVDLPDGEPLKPECRNLFKQDAVTLEAQLATFPHQIGNL